MVTDGYEVAVAIGFPCRSRSESDAEDECLVEDEHQHPWDEKVGIAARAVKDGYLVDIQWPCG